MQCSFRNALASALLALTLANPALVLAQVAPTSAPPAPRAAVTARRAGAQAVPRALPRDAQATFPPKIPDRMIGMKGTDALMVMGGAAVVIGVFVIGGDVGGVLATLGGATALYGLYLTFWEAGAGSVARDDVTGRALGRP